MLYPGPQPLLFPLMQFVTGNINQLCLLTSPIGPLLNAVVGDLKALLAIIRNRKLIIGQCKSFLFTCLIFFLVFKDIFQLRAKN